MMIFILSSIEGLFWAIFGLVGCYILFFLRFKPTYKFIIVGLLGVLLIFIYCYISKKIDKPTAK
jgi:hypothetical protein